MPAPESNFVNGHIIWGVFNYETHGQYDFDHRRVRNPGCQHSDIDTQRFELIVKRLAKAVYIRLRGSVIRHTGNAVFRTHCPREDQAAPPPLGEFRAEMVGDVQMRHRTEP